MVEKLLHVIDRRETYKIMALDIMRNLESGITKYDSERQIKDKVKDLIEDAYSDDFTKKRFGSAVQTIYTKVNKKPNKRVILEVAAKIAKNIKALFKRIKMVLEIEDSDINYILNMFSKLESQPRDKISSKIMDVYEIEDRDAKILVTHIEQCLNACSRVLSLNSLILMIHA